MKKTVVIIFCTKAVLQMSIILYNFVSLFLIFVKGHEQKRYCFYLINRFSYERKSRQSGDIGYSTKSVVPGARFIMKLYSSSNL